MLLQMTFHPLFYTHTHTHTHTHTYIYSANVYSFLKNIWGFPHGPVAKIPPPTAVGTGFIPGCRRFCMPRGTAKKEKISGTGCSPQRPLGWFELVPLPQSEWNGFHHTAFLHRCQAGNYRIDELTVSQRVWTCFKLINESKTWQGCFQERRPTEKTQKHRIWALPPGMLTDHGDQQDVSTKKHNQQWEAKQECSVGGVCSLRAVCAGESQGSWAEF